MRWPQVGLLRRFSASDSQEKIENLSFDAESSALAPQFIDLRDVYRQVVSLLVIRRLLEESLVDRLIIFAAFLVTGLLTAANKIVGGIVSLLVTLGVTLYGNMVYSQPGYTLLLGPIEIPHFIFIVMMLLWFGYDLAQIAAGVQEAAARRRALRLFREGKSSAEVLSALVNAHFRLSGQCQALARLALRGTPYERIIDGLIKGGESPAMAVLLYKLSVEEINRLLSVAESVRPEAMNASPLDRFEIPAVKVVSVGAMLGLHSDDLIFEYDDKLVSSRHELNSACALVPPSRDVSVKVLRLCLTEHGTFTGRGVEGQQSNWVVQETQLSGGPIDADLADTRPPQETASPVCREDFLRVACACGKRFRCESRFAGQRATCPSCQVAFVLPVGNHLVRRPTSR